LTSKFCNLAPAFTALANVSALGQPVTQEKRSSHAFDNTMPSIPGESPLRVLVRYPHSGLSKPHNHASSAFITADILEGAVRSQADDGPARVYHAGEYFTEKPAHHIVSENASKTEPAKMLAIFVLNTGVQPSSIQNP